MTDEILDSEQSDDTAVRGGGYFVAGLVLGALLGASTALLLAPASGRSTRRKLRHRFEELRDDAAGEIRDASRAARRELRRRVKDL